MSKEKHPGYTNVKLACGHITGLLAVPPTVWIVLMGESKAYEVAKNDAREKAKKFVCSYNICRAKHNKPIHRALTP